MDDASAVVGIGINVNNTNQPCLRTVLGKKERIARTPLLLSFLVHLKRILSAFWQERQQVLLLYYQRWRHFGQTIHCVDLHNTTRTMTICGLSENANICCRSQSGTLYELYPDPNCVDSVENMIAHPVDMATCSVDTLSSPNDVTPSPYDAVPYSTDTTSSPIDTIHSTDFPLLGVCYKQENHSRRYSSSSDVSAPSSPPTPASEPQLPSLWHHPRRPAPPE